MLIIGMKLNTVSAPNTTPTMPHGQSLLFLMSRLQRGLGLDGGLLQGDVTTHDRSFFSNRFETLSEGTEFALLDRYWTKGHSVCTGACETHGRTMASFWDGPNNGSMSETMNSPTPIEVPVRTRGWQSMVMVVCAGFM